jgi:hypothetical protein
VYDPSTDRVITTTQTIQRIVGDPAVQTVAGALSPWALLALQGVTAGLGMFSAIYAKMAHTQSVANADALGSIPNTSAIPRPPT